VSNWNRIALIGRAGGQAGRRAGGQAGRRAGGQALILTNCAINYVCVTLYSNSHFAQFYKIA
jgi:hypothetical protein